MSKAVLIGLDGATWNLIKPWVNEDKLPSLKRLMDKGTWGKLESTIPVLSPAAWTTIFTGVNPGKHSIFSFFKQKRGSYMIRPISPNDIKSKMIWEYLSQHGRRSVLINIPFSYPPKPLNGVMLTGLGTPSRHSDFTYPKDYKQYLLSIFPNYDVDFNEDLILRSKNRRFILDKIKTVTQENIRVAEYLFEKEEWDFFAVVLRTLDVIQHYYWNNKSIILEYYQQIDKFLDFILRNMTSDTTLFICSDHGFARTNTKVFINNWLERHNLLKIRKSKRKINIFPTAEMVQKLLVKIGLRTVVWRIKRSKFLEFLFRYVVRSEEYQHLFNIDWYKTKAYFLEGSYGIINVNLYGREPNGSVKLEDFENVRKLILSEAMTLKVSQSSGKVIKKAFRGEELYKSNRGYIPDIILFGNDGYRLVGGYNHHGKIFETEEERTGEHSLYGILIVYGSKVKEGRVDNANVCDITPTILYSLGLPISTEMDGRVLKEIFKDSANIHLVKYKEERERIKKKVEQLKSHNKV